MLTFSGLPSPQLRRKTTSTLFSAWQNFHPSSPSQYALAVRTASTILSRHTSVRRSPFTTLATSWLGTGSLPTLMRRHYGTSVATKVINPTTTGRNGQMIRQSLLCSTALRPPWVETAFSVAQTRPHMVFLPTLLL